jgi:hypothetical protein
MLGIIYTEMNRRYNYDYENIYDSCNKFKKKFDVFNYINDGDKLGIQKDGSIYIDRATMTQAISRWFSGQNRNCVIKSLEKSINEYVIFLRLVHTMIITNRAICNRPKITKLTEDVFKINNALLCGLDALEHTYKEDRNIVSKLKALKGNIDYRNTLLQDSIACS